MKSSVLFLLLFISLNIFSQSIDELKTSAFRDAKAASEATMNKDFNTLLEYTHPNVYTAFGKEELKDAMVEIFKTMEKENIQITSTEVNEVTEVKKENEEYHCLVKNTVKMDLNGKLLTIKSSLFGFYDDKQTRWSFVESNKLLNDPKTKELFPDFKTDITIPVDEQVFDN